MKSLHWGLHGKLWRRFHGLSEFVSSDKAWYSNSVVIDKGIFDHSLYFSYNTKCICSHKLLWWHCNYTLNWTCFYKTKLIIFYWCTLHFSQMPTHYHRLFSFVNNKDYKSGQSPLLHWVPMLAYQAHVAQSFANNNVKPSFFFHHALSIFTNV